MTHRGRGRRRANIRLTHMKTGTRISSHAAPILNPRPGESNWR
ncbi:hypothetical protein ACFFX0_31700 [Citricoccus parietis]|uniref:Uncharacterized protein n=1 Tax=Citricoccus parietis TaxID=592307 RepID=A0ABV5G969_9MICC